MASPKFFSLLVLASLALLACSFGPLAVNALSTGGVHGMRRAHVHDSIAQKKKKRNNSARCKPRSSGITALTTSSTSTTTSQTHTPKTTHTPTPTPSPKVSSGASGSSGSGGSGSTNAAILSGNFPKAGFAWPNGDSDDICQYQTGRTGAVYTWDSYLPSNAASCGLVGWPQLWGGDQTRLDNFKNLVVEGYSDVVLGFNEPNEPGQSNMDPSWAAQIWIEYIEPLKGKGYTRCSPATSGNPNGFTWMENFLNACNGGCTWEITCTHWYDITLEGFQEWLEKWHTTYGKPVMPTEFALQNFNGPQQPTEDEVNAFFAAAIPWLDAQPWIPAYFAFGWMSNMQGVDDYNRMMNTNGVGATALGQKYIYGY